MCIQEVQVSPRDRQFGKTSECAHKRSNSQHGIVESARLPNMHTRCSTLNTGKAVWQDFRMCTQEVQLSTRDRKGSLTRLPNVHNKMSNSPHGKGNLARLPTMHTRGATLNTGVANWQDFRMFTQNVQLSTRER
ncbi:hypothetical protein PoB_001077200 [Plakobranchus ocellatus]|uniref:Uncharacterized protein n=1 Tax=Plakobranchus ocellatus TaxID=259542 RepID=A0AAV3YPB0_9GAST|nr:hypothetical protein PoB_001077200 [Plakobranchus ocellatus]